MIQRQWVFVGWFLLGNHRELPRHPPMSGLSDTQRWKSSQLPNRDFPQPSCTRLSGFFTLNHKCKFLPEMIISLLSAQGILSPLKLSILQPLLLNFRIWFSFLSMWSFNLHLFYGEILRDTKRVSFQKIVDVVHCSFCSVMHIWLLSLIVSSWGGGVDSGSSTDPPLPG